MEYNINQFQTFVSATALASFISAPKASHLASTMAAARTVKDVSPHEFVKAYSAHLKRSGKVYIYIDILSLCYVPLSLFLEKKKRRKVLEID